MRPDRQDSGRGNLGYEAPVAPRQWAGLEAEQVRSGAGPKEAIFPCGSPLPSTNTDVPPAPPILICLSKSPGTVLAGYLQNRSLQMKADSPSRTQRHTESYTESQIIFMSIHGPSQTLWHIKIQSQ